MAGAEKVSLAVSLDGHVAPAAVVGLARLVYRLTDAGILHSLTFGENGFIDAARNEMVAHILKSTPDTTHIMWVHANVEAPDGVMDALLAAHKPVVTARAASRDYGSDQLEHGGISCALVEADVYRKMESEFSDQRWHLRRYPEPDDVWFAERCRILDLDVVVAESVEAPRAWGRHLRTTSVESGLPFPKNRARVALGLPLFEPVSPYALISLLRVVRLAAHSGRLRGLLFTQGLFYDVARNTVVDAFLESPERYTHLLWLDSDMVVPPEIVDRLLDSGKRVTAGLYHRKRPNFEPAAFSLDPVSPYTGSIEGTVRIEGVALGATMVERSVFEEMDVRYGDGLWHVAADGYGEDVWFSRRCKELGIEIWLDGTLQCGHVLDRMVTTSDWLNFRSKR